MKLKHVLTEDVIELDLKGSGKQEIIEELLDILMRTGKVSDREDALAQLLAREQKMSTGIQFGVAIPHAKTRAVKELVACIGIKREGVDFAALDGKQSDLFIMTLSSTNRTGPHVQFLAEISMVLKDEQARERILAAGTAKEVLAVFGL
jgi:fructose-specific phosphotransferase system IIA component